MGRASSYELYDRIAGGDLGERIRRWYEDEGLTFEQIAERLRAEDIADVASTTVWRWCTQRLGIIPRTAAAERAS